MVSYSRAHLEKSFKTWSVALSQNYKFVGSYEKTTEVFSVINITRRTDVYIKEKMH